MSNQDSGDQQPPERRPSKPVRVHETVVVDLSPRLDPVSNTLLPMAAAADGTLPGGGGFVIVREYATDDDATKAMTKRYATGGRREIVEFQLNGALRVDGISERDLSLELIRSGSRQAIALLEAARNAGADMVYVRADGPGEIDENGVDHLTVMFTDAFDDVATEIRRFPWTSPDAKRQADDRSSLSPMAMLRRGPAKASAFLAWQVAVAVAVSLVADPLIGLLGSSVSVPLAVPVALFIIVSLTVGWGAWIVLLDVRDRALLAWREGRSERPPYVLFMQASGEPASSDASDDTSDDTSDETSDDAIDDTISTSGSGDPEDDES